MVTPAAQVDKACEWNRYCRYVGPLCTGPVVQVGVGRPEVVARCYHCGRYVCNRCAARIGDRALVAGLWRAGVWTLVCPFDGVPLGRDGVWTLTGPGLGTVLRLTEDPGFEDWCRVLANPLPPPDQERLDALVEAWAAGRDEAVIGFGEWVVPDAVVPLVQLMTRQSLERLGRFDEAWAIQQRLLTAAPTGYLKGIGLVSPLLPPGTQRDSLVSELRQLAKTEGGGLEAALSRFSSGLSAALDPGEPPVPTSDRGSAAPVAHALVRGTAARDPSPALPGRSPIPELGLEAVASLWESWPAPWNPTTWSGFVLQCERDHGLVFPGGAEAFASRVRSPGSPLLGLLLVALRNDPGELPSGALDTVEHYAIACARRTPDWPEAGQDADRLLRPLDQLGAERLRLDPEPTPGQHEAVEACPLVVARNGVLRFAHPAYGDAFLARVLGRRLFCTDPPDFRSLGSVMLSQGTAEFLAELVARDPGRVARLGEWLRFRRQRRSQYRGAQIPAFLRNLTLVQYALDRDLRGLDLRELDFRDLDLAGADCRNAVLDGAVFRDCGLREARFAGASLNGTDLQGADLEGSDLERR